MRVAPAPRRRSYLLDTATLKWDHPLTTESTPAGRQRHTACLVHSKKLFVMGACALPRLLRCCCPIASYASLPPPLSFPGGFDGFKWLSDCHVLDVGKLEEQSIAHASLGSLLSDLGTLVNNPDSFPDVSFTVGGRPVYAHKVGEEEVLPLACSRAHVLSAPASRPQSILAARSAHFRAMFASGFREGREQAAPIDYGDQWSSSAFVLLLEFLYTGTVQVRRWAGSRGMRAAPHAARPVFVPRCRANSTGPSPRRSCRSRSTRASRDSSPSARPPSFTPSMRRPCARSFRRRTAVRCVRKEGLGPRLAPRVSSRRLDKLQAPELKRVCLDFILKHSDAVNLEALSSEPILLIEITREVIARSSKS